MQILIDYLLGTSDRQLLERKLQALLTSKEVSEMEHRLQILDLLEQGLPQREIAERLGVGIATVTRGARAWLCLPEERFPFLPGAAETTILGWLQSLFAAQILGSTFVVMGLPHAFFHKHQ